MDVVFFREALLSLVLSFKNWFCLSRSKKAVRSAEIELSVFLFQLKLTLTVSLSGDYKQ